MSKTADAGQTLAESLANRIQRDGPITFHDWMQAALYDEQLGYYCRTDLKRWGREGDYRTSPDTSALFGATFGRYFVELFNNERAAGPFTIVEAGAGAGHFAAALLETLQRRYKGIFERTTCIIDEISPTTRAQLVDRVARFGRQVQFQRLSELRSIKQGIVFANELMDAFPVHRVKLHNGKLMELYVGLDDDHSFGWREGTVSSARVSAYLDRFKIRLREGQVVEINTGIEDWFSQVRERLDRGYLVTVDYGSEAGDLYSRNQGTLRAFRQHQFVDVLSSPGEQDITSSINWTAAREIGKDLGFELVRFERLDRFLLQSGLLEELELRVDESEDESEKLRLRTSAREMILPGGMAENFQVMVQY
jgi:SAM-dependent MidA family methyltransferase